MRCLDENGILQLVEGRLPPARAAEVDEHLAGCDDCRALLVTCARSSPDGVRTPSGAPVVTEPAAPPAPPRERLARGETVGRYVVLHEIGAGGMGVVSLAFDPELDRKVALKLLRPEAARPDLAQRLLREAQAMARVAHPHVIAVHDVGTHQGRVFLAMEFVDGGTLAQWQRAQERGARAILDAYLAAGRGLAAAHAAGLVHRDFKPDNDAWARMRTEACEATRVRGEQSEDLLDLRMQCLDQRLSDERALVDELVHADAKLVGRAVQAASSLPALALCADAALLKAQARPPSDPAARAQADELRAQLSRGRALFGTGKYKDALALLEPLVARARTLPDRLLQAEVLLLEGRALDVLGRGVEALPILREAALDAEIARRDDLAARAWIHQLFITGYEQRHFAEGLAYADFVRAALERQPNLEMENFLEQQLGAVLGREGKPQEALPHLERGLSLAEKRLGKDDPQLTKAEEALAVALVIAGRSADALPHFERALELRVKLVGPDHPDTGLLVGNIGFTLLRLHRYAEAEVSMRRSIEVLEKALGPDHRDLANQLGGLGSVLTLLGRPLEALPPLRRSTAIAEALHDGDDLRGAMAALGRALLAAGKDDEARAVLERAVTIDARSAENIAEAQVQLARAVQRTNPARAQALARQAEKALGPPGGDDLADLRAQVAGLLGERSAGR